MNFQACVRQSLGKHAGKRWKEIVCDIAAVIEGIKPSFLYDYSSCDPDSLLKLATKVERELVTSLHCHGHGHGTCHRDTKPENLQENNDSDGKRHYKVDCHTSEICILVVKDDVFIVNRYASCNAIHQFLSKLGDGIKSKTDADSSSDALPYSTMDVTGTLSSPTWVNKKIVRHIKFVAEKILRQIEEGFAEPQRDRIFHLYLNDEWNLSTIFGILLGYPAVYWYQIDVQHNCLAHTPLHVFKCVCDFLVPETSTSKSEVGKSFSMEKQSHTVYSFSIPDVLLPDIAASISRWKENIAEMINASHICSFRSFYTSSVTLPAVVL